MSDYNDRKRGREDTGDDYDGTKRYKTSEDRYGNGPYASSSSNGGSYGNDNYSRGGGYSSYGGGSSYGNGSSYGSRDSYTRGGSYGNDDYRSSAPPRSAETDAAFEAWNGTGGLIGKDMSDESVLFSRPNTGINFDKYDNIQVNVEGYDVPAPINAFSEAKLHDLLMANIALARYDKPTPVQKYSLPIISVANRDLMASAQTGSGKTGGFLFPIVDGLLKSGARTFRPRRGESALPYAVVLAPTRELAVQIYQECEKFVYRTGLRAVCVYGGTPLSRQAREIERGVDIVIAAPGRLQDMYDRKHISFRNVQYLCLDEADRMLDMGFEQAIRSLVERSDMPGIANRKTMMFSATFPRPIQRLAADFMRDYLFLKVGPVGSTSENITQRIKWVENRDKEAAVAAEMKAIPKRTLIFVETKRNADYLARVLSQQGFTCQSIHGDRSQYERERALEDFKINRINTLIATSVAARGLDIDAVEHVINYDLPNNIDDYVHRIGRTGRAGNVGLATAFYNADNAGIARELIEKLSEAKQEIPDWLERERWASGKGGGGNRYGGRGGRGGGGNRFGSSGGHGSRGGSGGYGSGGRGGYGGYGGGSGGYGNRGGYGGAQQSYGGGSYGSSAPSYGSSAPSYGGSYGSYGSSAPAAPAPSSGNSYGYNSSAL